LQFGKAKNKRKRTIQRHMQHWIQDTKQRTNKMKNKHRKLKIYTEPPTRKK